MAVRSPDLNARFRNIRRKSHFSAQMLLSSEMIRRIISNSSIDPNLPPGDYITRDELWKVNPNADILHNHHFPVQVDVLGAGGVGKTTLIKKFLESKRNIRVRSDDTLAFAQNSLPDLRMRKDDFEHTFLYKLFVSSLAYPLTVTDAGCNLNPKELHISEHGYFGNLLITAACFAILSNVEKRKVRHNLKSILPHTSLLITYPISIVNIIARPSEISKRNQVVPKLFQNQGFAEEYYLQSLAYHWLAKEYRLPCLYYVALDGEQDLEGLSKDFNNAIRNIYCDTLAYRKALLTYTCNSLEFS